MTPFRKAACSNICIREYITYIYTHVSVHVHIYVYIYTHTQHRHTYIHNIGIRRAPDTCIHTCNHTYVYVYIHTYTYSHRSAPDTAAR